MTLKRNAEGGTASTTQGTQTAVVRAELMQCDCLENEGLQSLFTPVTFFLINNLVIGIDLNEPMTVL